MSKNSMQNWIQCKKEVSLYLTIKFTCFCPQARSEMGGKQYPIFQAIFY